MEEIYSQMNLTESLCGMCLVALLTFGCENERSKQYGMCNS